MTVSKRIFDLLVAFGLIVLLALPFAALVLWLWLREGRPVFYVSERMRAPGRPFWLWKLRTMTVVAGAQGVSGGHKSHRITATGRILRKTRADEIPQLWNVVKGDMSFVGPRPPLRDMVERFPEIYGQVLKNRPGITGLASIAFHRHEEWLLAASTTPEQTDAIYVRRCVPRKARLDLIYQSRQSLWLDIKIMVWTLLRALRLMK